MTLLQLAHALREANCAIRGCGVDVVAARHVETETRVVARRQPDRRWHVQTIPHTGRGTVDARDQEDPRALTSLLLASFDVTQEGTR